MLNTEKMPRIYFTGVGGQGTLTATRLLAFAAMDENMELVAGEVHGMAQRGGVVESSLLLGGWRAPRLDYGEADIILGFEPLETLRGLPYLRQEGGYVFSSSDFLPPPSVSLGREECPAIGEIARDVEKAAAKCCFLPCRGFGSQCGSMQAGNTALLGALCASGILPFGLSALEGAIRNHLPEKFWNSNLKAMRLGADWLEKAWA